jgi:hypothetical protein
MSTYANLPDVPVARPRLYWSAARLAYAREQFAAEPFDPKEDVLAQAAVALLHPKPSQRKHYGRLVAGQLVAFEIAPQQGMRPDANGCDRYRWNQWVAPALDWCWDYLTPAERDLVVKRYTGYVRTVMQQKWGGRGMAFNNYFIGNLTNEVCLAAATWHEQDVRDILDFAVNARWRKDFLPLVSRRKNAAGQWEAGPNWGGASPDGSAYGQVIYSYPVIPWLTFPKTFATDWFVDVVITLAHWISPVPMAARGNPALFPQLFPVGDDETPDGFPNGAARPYLGDFLTAAQALLKGRPEAGYARTLLDYGLPVSKYLLYGIPPGPIRRLTDLPLDRRASFWDFWRQSWKPDATRIMIQLAYGAGGGHNHHDVGSFQVAKGKDWLTKEHTGYATKFVDCAAEDAEPHNVITFWQAKKPYGGYGPLTAFLQGNPVLDTLWGHQQPSNHSYCALDLTPAYRANRKDLDPTWVHRVLRQYLYLRDVDVLLVVDRLSADRELLRRFHLNLTDKPEQRNDGSWLCPGGMIFRTLWPAHAENRVIYMGYNGAPYPNLYGYRLDVCTHEDFFIHALCCSGEVRLGLDADWTVHVGDHAVRLARGLNLDRPKVDGVPIPAGT